MQYVFLALLFSLLVATFAVQNALPVTVTFMVWSFQLSLVIIILGSATFGAMIVLSLATLMQFRLRHMLQKNRQQLGELKAENSTLQDRLAQKKASDLSENDL